MSAQIIDFPINRVLPTIVPFCGFSSEMRTVKFENNLHEPEADKDFSDRENKDFNKIVEDEELGREMFPPDYFMLVE